MYLEPLGDRDVTNKIKERKIKYTGRQRNKSLLLPIFALLEPYFQSHGLDTISESIYYTLHLYMQIPDTNFSYDTACTVGLPPCYQLF